MNEPSPAQLYALMNDMLKAFNTQNALTQETNRLLQLIADKPVGGSGYPPQYDVVCKTYDNTRAGVIPTNIPLVGFSLEFKTRFTKDNPEKQAQNKELKSKIQSFTTYALGANKHYTIEKVEKQNKDKTKSWQEWIFHFDAQYAAAIGLRLESAEREFGAKVSGLDDLAKLAKTVGQIELAAPVIAAPPANATPTPPSASPRAKYMHLLGNQYAAACALTSDTEVPSWDATRHAFATTYLNRKVETFTDMKPDEIDKLIMILLRLLVGEHGHRIYGISDWISQKESDGCKWASEGKTDSLGGLDEKQLQKLLETIASKPSKSTPEAPRRL